MVVLAGAKIDATDFTLPDVTTGYGSGTNTVTATAWAVLPTTTCTATITNPHPTADMLCLVTYGAWMSASAINVRMGLDVSGSLTIAPGVGGGAAIGWGEIPYTADTAAEQKAGSCTLEIPAAGTVTLKIYAYRDSASGTQAVNYPTIRVIPIRYLP